jgi:O-antigen biosynthesis protein
MTRAITKAPASFTGETRALIHELNQRCRAAWDRAERLQAELDAIRGSRAWRLFTLWRRIKAWFCSPLAPREDSDSRSAGDALLSRSERATRATVSIIIPFKDRVALLRNCLRGLRTTHYRRFEIILVDNGSTCARTRRALTRCGRRRRITILSAPGPFNFSKLCNRGAAQARGEYLLFLNNDIEVMHQDWLERLLEPAGHSEVGMVGATLFYPDGTLQHAGIFPLPNGTWTHAHRGVSGEALPPELTEVRTVPAVTGACLLIRRDRFRDLGGFDESLPLTHNDVDLCCRARARGWLVAVTPHARLVHYESLSRGYTKEAQPNLARLKTV